MRVGAGCGEAEILAGAIALGEAGDAERNAYREHLSVCRRCLVSIGGEREIERVMNVIADARAQEHWQPQTRGLFAGAKSRRPFLRWGAAAAAALLVVFVARQGYQSHPAVVHSVTPAAQTGVSAEQEARVVAALGTQSVPKREHHAESLAFSARENAAQTITVKVSFNAAGKPTHCKGLHRANSQKLVATLCNMVMRGR
ncbi:MAG TPA: hypothetical protein VIX83_04710 [Candidatus Cybelea sp.]